MSCFRWCWLALACPAASARFIQRRVGVFFVIVKWVLCEVCSDVSGAGLPWPALLPVHALFRRVRVFGEMIE